MSVLCSFIFLSFDQNSRIFIIGQIDFTIIQQWIALAFTSLIANWLAIVSFQLLDPFLCSVLRAQEIVFAYIAQAIVLNVIPCNLSFIGASMVVLSAVCSSLEKFIVPQLPEKCGIIC